MSTNPISEIRPRQFEFQVDSKVATITLNRPERKNALTFDSYHELTEAFEKLSQAAEIKAVVIIGTAENFCSGGDVNEIIGPLVQMQEQKQSDRLLAFTRMTGQLVKAMRACPQPIV